MARRARIPGVVVSNWHRSIEGLEASPMDFYSSVESAVAKRELPNVKVSRVSYREGGWFSARREYLRVKRKGLIFDICGAPFGNGFFISWWLAERNWLAILSAIPVVGLVFLVFNLTHQPRTYYKLDTASMYQDLVHSSVLEVLDAMMEGKGLRALTEADRKPVMRDFFQKQPFA